MRTLTKTQEVYNTKQFYTDNDGNLFFRSPLNNIIKQTNCLKWKNINIEEFEKMSLKKIKRHKYNELFNKFHKSVKMEWVYNGETYRKMDNIEVDNYGIVKNYIIDYIGDKIGDNVIPTHEITSYSDTKAFKGIFKGKAYYFSYYSGGSNGLCMYDINTEEYIGFATIKNISPIYNVTRKKIC